MLLPRRRPPAPDPDCSCEFDEIAGWRMQQLLEAGYGIDEAELIALSRIDLHDAIELVTVQGCPPVTAARILL